MNVLDDPEFPVRVQAALALTEMVIQYKSGVYLLSLDTDMETILTYPNSENGCWSPSRKSHSKCVSPLPLYAL